MNELKKIGLKAPKEYVDIKSTEEGDSMYRIYCEKCKEIAEIMAISQRCSEYSSQIVNNIDERISMIKNNSDGDKSKKSDKTKGKKPSKKKDKGSDDEKSDKSDESDNE